MNLTKKLIFGFLAISVFSAIVGYVGLVSMKFVDSGFQSLADETIPTMMVLKDLKASSLGVFTTTIEPAYMADFHGIEYESEEDGSRDRYITRFEKSFKDYSSYVGSYFPGKIKIKDEIKSNWNVFLGISDKIERLKDTNASENEILANGKDFEESRNNLEKTINEAIALESVEIEEKKEAVRVTISRSLIAIFIILVLSVISATIIGIIFARSILKPVIELLHISSDAKLAYPGVKRADVQSDDEFGELAGSFNNMVESIKKRDFEISLKNKELEKSKKELEEKLLEFEQFNKLAVGRELKMVELKKKIRELEGKK